MPDAVRIEGLRDLRRDLRAMDRALPKQLNASLRAAMKPVIGAARAPHLTGRLAASLRPFATARAAGVRSSLPYAAPIHWGWPRRNIKAQPFISEAAESRMDAIIDEVGDGIEDLAKRNGWR